MRVTPKVSPTELEEKSALKHNDGRVYHGEIPAVLTDAEFASTANPDHPGSPYRGSKHFDSKGHAANRALEKDLKAAFAKHKKTDKDGAHFVLAWRMYPNKDHPRWQQEEPHICGCGCGGLGHL